MFTVNWEAFTPYPALFGGLLIGLSAVMLILLTGRVAGISGIVGGLLKPQHGEFLWRLSFVLGMAAAPWLYQAVVGSFEFESPRGTVALVVAGLLVGYGTRLGSGHQWARRVRAFTPVAAFADCHGRFHGHRFRGGLNAYACYLREAKL